MDRFLSMQAFVRVAEAGSFSEAARSLGVSKAVVSERVKQLESLLRHTLLHRTTRSVRLTEAGAGVFPVYVDLVKRIDDIENNIGDAAGAISGRLRVASVVDFGITELAPVISRFAQANPGVAVELILDTNAVNPIDGGFDLAVHFRKLRTPSVIERHLLDVHSGYFASPEYVARHGSPGRPEDLAVHPCITYSYQPNVNPWNVHDWEVGRDGISTSVHVPSAMSSNNGHVVREFAVGGHGVAVLPIYRVALDVAEGRLLRVLPGYAPPVLPLWAVFPAAHAKTAKLQRLVSYLSEAFESGLPRPPPS